jgi:hypothetical protein
VKKVDDKHNAMDELVLAMREVEWAHANGYNGDINFNIGREEYTASSH